MEALESEGSMTLSSILLRLYNSVETEDLDRKFSNVVRGWKSHAMCMYIYILWPPKPTLVLGLGRRDRVLQLAPTLGIRIAQHS